jgi:uncharacterized protein YdeI (YjbR/CyaY-like superfamily)
MITQETFCPASRLQWRRWLQRNHGKKESIWLVYYKKETGKPTISWSEAVDEALCFGWIDGRKKSVDDETFMQLFSRRKPNGTWSKVNKEKVRLLTEEGLMTKTGLDCIEAAKKNGSWSILDDVEELKIPKDLEKEFKSFPGSRRYFNSLSRSVRKSILQWLVLAKRPDTRRRRVVEIAELAARKQKPAQF